ILLSFFFFSSRRRHTIFSRDWSSDVCSSDLGVDTVMVRDPVENGECGEPAAERSQGRPVQPVAQEHPRPADLHLPADTPLRVQMVNERVICHPLDDDLVVVAVTAAQHHPPDPPPDLAPLGPLDLWHRRDRKSTRLNSSHVKISYAVFCLKKQNA